MGLWIIGNCQGVLVELERLDLLIGVALHDEAVDNLLRGESSWRELLFLVFLIAIFLLLLGLDGLQELFMTLSMVDFERPPAVWLMRCKRWRRCFSLFTQFIRIFGPHNVTIHFTQCSIWMHPIRFHLICIEADTTKTGMNSHKVWAPYIWAGDQVRFIVFDS